MDFHLTPIFKDIMSRASDKVLCEQRIDWQTPSDIMIKGQYDISFVNLDGDLCVEDLKYGWGIVEVFENWQLLAYAIGEVIRRGQAFQHIHLTIHQPRPHHEDGESRTWTVTYDELLDYKDRIETRLMDISKGENTLQTNPKCKYCMGAGEACPAFSRLFYRALEVSTEFFQDSINDDELADQLDQIKRAEEVIKIKKDSLFALGSSRIKAGKIIPGYVQVASYGNRAWKKGISPEVLKVMTGKNLIKETFMTPAQAEKMGVPRSLVSGITEKFFKGNKLEKKDSTEVGNKIFGNDNPNGGK